MQERNKTRTKAFRFDIRVIDELARAAKHAGTTENAFVSAILTERLVVEPIARAFHRIELNDEVIQFILGGTNANTLELAGSEIARKQFPLIWELYRSIGNPLTFRAFLTEVLGKHMGWFSIEGIDYANPQSMTLRHYSGIKWSMFVKSYIQSAFELISKDKITIETGDQFVRIDFCAA